MKPALFNTEMVCAIHDDLKTATRRPVKQKGWKITGRPSWGDKEGRRFWFDVLKSGSEVATARTATCHLLEPPYQPGDILYVRETWTKLFCVDPDGYTHYDQEMYYYAADGTPDITMVDADGFELDDPRIRWRPSIHMPKEAARLFLRVTDVQVERLQDITDEQARKEGCADRKDFARVWNDCYAKPRAVKGVDGTIDHYESYPWEGIQETSIYRGKPWYVIGNSWLWAIEFERIGRE